MNRTRFCLVFILFLVSYSKAAVKLPAIISDHMVLQQRARVKLWGLAKPFGKVIIQPSWSRKTYTALTDGTGAWEIKISTAKAGGPFRISFNDGEELILNDVLLGEVWVCSGQSNMVMPLKGYDKGQNVLNGEQLIASSSRYKGIRVFDVPKLIAPVPIMDCKGMWKASNPENAPGFSAIAFQYATILSDRLHVPVGIITICWGSTAIQSWMSKKNLEQFPEITITSRLDTMKVPAKNPEALTAGLFNGMIAPVTRYGIKGFIWYQGESNKDAPLYQKLFPAMVKEWRKVWGMGELPFYYVQIAPFNYQDRNTALLREAQLQARIPNSGMVVAMDAGQVNRIHPPDKTVISQRLAGWALAKTYKQKNIAYKSPELKTTRFNQTGAILTFKNVYKGLKAPNNSLTGFEVAGNDQIFYPASATISGKDEVHIACENVKQPVAVRYAFTNWAMPELFNSANLPASSFTTR